MQFDKEKKQCAKKLTQRVKKNTRPRTTLNLPYAEEERKRKKAKESVRS